jgi:hypothetical protein
VIPEAKNSLQDITADGSFSFLRAGEQLVEYVEESQVLKELIEPQYQRVTARGKDCSWKDQDQG